MNKDGPAGSKQQHKQSKLSSEIRQAFVACPRCSFFLMGYELLHKDLDDATISTNGKWLELTWDLNTLNLVNKSYGVNLRHDDSHYEGLCIDCRRTFIFDESTEEEESQTYFRIKINPSR